MYQILIDAQLIDEETKIIKDSEKGHKGYFYTTIQKFFEKGYFKRKPSVEEYLNICNNSFSVSVSKHTASNIKTIKRSNLPIPSFQTK